MATTQCPGVVCVTLLILALMGIVTPSLGSLTSEQTLALDGFVENIMACRHIPGVTLSLVKGDTVLLQKGYGFADLETRERVTKKTLFPIASTTKAFTATVLAKLIEDSNGR